METVPTTRNTYPPVGQRVPERAVGTCFSIANGRDKLPVTSAIRLRLLRWTALLCLLSLLVAGRATQAGRVQTLDGRSLEGEVRITNGAVLVRATNTVLALVPLTNLFVATLEDPDAAAAGPSSGQGVGLLGYYFSTTNADGTAFVRLDETIDFDWALGEPAPDLPRDMFSVVWAGELEAPVSGPFSLFIAADDVGQFFLTNQLLIQIADRRAQPETASAIVALEAGARYPIRFIYTELTGPARARFLWSGPNIPKSVVPGRFLHPTGVSSRNSASINTNRGLLATYYRDQEFRGSSFSRIDPGIDFDWSDRDPAPGVARTNFSVRWSGQLQVDYTEEYTFYTMTDERVRVWLDRKVLIDRPDQAWLAESKESVPLVAGEKYDFRMETRSSGGGAVARLFWSSASVPKTNPPSSHFTPSQPARAGPALDAGNKTGPGVVLRNGSFVAGTVDQASETSLRLSGQLQHQPLTTVKVARILCQPLSPTLAARILPGRPGVLLTKGDFVDGDFRGLEDGRVTMSSILFGLRAYDARTQVLAIALRDVSQEPGTFEVRLRDRSSLLPGLLELEADTFKLADSALGMLRLPAADVLEIRRRGPGHSGR